MRCAFGFVMPVAVLALAACGGKGGECTEPSDAAGVWEITATNISDSCSSGIVSYTFPMAIAQDGNTLSAQNHGGTLTGTVCGDRIQMSGAVPGRYFGGTTTANLRLTISADGNSVEGSDTWNWTRGAQSCGGSESLSGTRAGDDVCDWPWNCPCLRVLDCEGSSCPTYEQALVAAEKEAVLTRCLWFESCLWPGGFGAGRCGDLRYVKRDCHVQHTEFFDASGTLVAAYFFTDDCGTVCAGSCSADYGFRPECELEQETDFCAQVPELTCCHWCLNEPEGPSCHQGPPESVRDCYDSCLEDYNREEEQSGCGDIWLRIKACEMPPEGGNCDYWKAKLARCQADSYCEANCPTQHRQECIEQYLTTGVCDVGAFEVQP